MSDQDEVIIRVEPTPYTNEIWVMIPTQYWHNDKLADGIKKAVELTFLKQAPEQVKRVIAEMIEEP